MPTQGRDPPNRCNRPDQRCRSRGRAGRSATAGDPTPAGVGVTPYGRRDRAGEPAPPHGGRNSTQAAQDAPGRPRKRPQARPRRRSRPDRDRSRRPRPRRPQLRLTRPPPPPHGHRDPAQARRAATVLGQNGQARECTEGHRQEGFDLNLSFRVCQDRRAEVARPAGPWRSSNVDGAPPRRIELRALGSGPAKIGVPNFLSTVRIPPSCSRSTRPPACSTASAGRSSRASTRSRPTTAQPQRLLHRRAGLDAVHARHLEGFPASTPTRTASRTPSTRSTRSSPRRAISRPRRRHGCTKAVFAYNTPIGTSIGGPDARRSSAAFRRRRLALRPRRPLPGPRQAPTPARSRRPIARPRAPTPP